MFEVRKQYREFLSDVAEKDCFSDEAKVTKIKKHFDSTTFKTFNVLNDKKH